MAFGVASVEDDGAVVGDSERAQSGLELLGRTAVPVLRVLEPVGVEIERLREVVLLVLPGDAEVDVEEQEPAGGCGLRPSPLEQLP